MNGIRVRGLFLKFFSMPRSYVQRSIDDFESILCLRDELVCLCVCVCVCGGVLSKSYDNIFRQGGGGTGVEGAESGVDGAESGVEGAGSGDRGGGEPGKIGAGN